MKFSDMNYVLLTILVIYVNPIEFNGIKTNFKKLIYLNKIARRQVGILMKNKSIGKLENLKNMDNNGKLLIEDKVRIGDDIK